MALAPVAAQTTEKIVAVGRFVEFLRGPAGAAVIRANGAIPAP